MALDKGSPVLAIMAGLKKKDGAGPPGPEESGPDDLHVASQDLIDAVHKGDVEGVAAAFHAAFMACESQPHEESEPGEEEG